MYLKSEERKLVLKFNLKNNGTARSKKQCDVSQKPLLNTLIHVAV